MRRLPPALLALTLAASWGQGVGAAPAAGAADKSDQPFFDLQSIGLPAVVHGRLVNYVFVQVRLMLAKGVDASKLQGEEPYIRDALVRAATRSPFNPPEDGVHLQEGRLKAEVMREAVARLGPGKVAAVIIRSELPERRAGVPGGAAP